jgi:hypothetical protein
MEEYTKIYEACYTTLKKCSLTSKKYEGIPSPTSQHFYASILFTRICVIAMSIIQLSPPPELIGKENTPWDFSSVSSLTRNLIECYLTFFYLCIDKCNKDEQDARLKLMNLHDHTSRTKMFESLQPDEAKKFKENNDEVISPLKNNNWFKKLSDKQQVHFLKGNSSFFKKNDEIVKDSGGDISDFKFKYKFLSSHTHSSPMGFYRTSNDRGRGIETPTEIQYTGICLEWINEYLTKANTEFIELFEHSLSSDV